MEPQDGPIVVSVINMKGGVGKSTIAALLGRYAARRGRKVLAIDLDPQANLSQAFMTHSYREFLRKKKPSIVEVFRGYRSPSAGVSSPRRFDVADAVVGGTPLGGTNLQLIPARFDFSKHLIDSLKPDQHVLASLLSEHFTDRELILIDCAPTESIFTRAAYAASRHVLVPVKPEYFATIMSESRQSRTVEMAQDALESELRSIIDRFGYDQVAWSLRRIARADLRSRVAATGHSRRRNDRAPKRSRPKPAEYVSRMDLPADRRQMLIEAAERFENRSFLPTMGDVRNFCELYGIKPLGSSSRASAVPRLFKFMATMDAGEVRRLLRSGMFSGPARLGPIADAIRDAGQERSRNRDLRAEASVRGMTE